MHDYGAICGEILELTVKREEIPPTSSYSVCNYRPYIVNCILDSQGRDALLYSKKNLNLHNIANI